MAQRVRRDEDRGEKRRGGSLVDTMPRDLHVGTYKDEAAVDIREYEQSLSPDKNDLDTELVAQPNLFYRVSLAASYSAIVAKRAKILFETEETRVNADAREDLERTREGKGRITNAMVAEHAASDKHLIKAREEYHAAQLEADRWDALRNAYQQRSYVLKDLVTLYVNSYYQDSTGKQDRGDGRDRVAQSNRERMGDERERRRRE